MHAVDVQMMNKDQEEHMGLGNTKHEMLKKSKIRRRKVEEFNNQMWPKGLQ